MGLQVEIHLCICRPIQHSVSIMEFTDDEKKWLEEISSEVPESGKLTPHEQLLHDLAKPESVLEEVLFEFMACVRFGLLTDYLFSSTSKTYA
ncbi:hypothetical protein MATL_G00091990 [Megalops atlanticus]|uniref:Uncharacterized protein n=1 Tax=Megalops atlanticus TaxID=7932 RepID=A0A9D3TFX1_MEGAT|nr:hypothetical protein MATL_G00091990 [Megalops atlanticus]